MLSVGATSRGDTIPLSSTRGERTSFPTSTGGGDGPVDDISGVRPLVVGFNESGSRGLFALSSIKVRPASGMGNSWFNGKAVMISGTSSVFMARKWRVQWETFRAVASVACQCPMQRTEHISPGCNKEAPFPSLLTRGRDK